MPSTTARTRLGLTLVIANPMAQSGRGADGATAVRRFLEIYDSATSGFTVRLTKEPGDAERTAAEAAGFDTVIALGGDGVVHEVLNGLMRIEAPSRPCLGVIPLGSGNDFGRTLGLTLNNPERSLAELMTGGRRRIDVGRVTSDACPEGTYFAETLSFGLDAAIALDTTKRRAEGTRLHGPQLFLASSIRMFSRPRTSFPCTVRLDGGVPQVFKTLIFAVQNGPTYGGGFQICPDASPTDGLLDVCYNVRHPLVVHLLALLGLARFGRHVSSSALRLATVRQIELDFAGAGRDCPCQVDGEPLEGMRFAVEVVPAAVRVVVPSSCPW